MNTIFEYISAYNNEEITADELIEKATELSDTFGKNAEAIWIHINFILEENGD